MSLTGITLVFIALKWVVWDWNFLFLKAFIGSSREGISDWSLLCGNICDYLFEFLHFALFFLSLLIPFHKAPFSWNFIHLNLFIIELLSHESIDNLIFLMSEANVVFFSFSSFSVMCDLSVFILLSAEVCQIY